MVTDEPPVYSAPPIGDKTYEVLESAVDFVSTPKIHEGVFGESQHEKAREHQKAIIASILLEHGETVEDDLSLMGKAMKLLDSRPKPHRFSDTWCDQVLQLDAVDKDTSLSVMQVKADALLVEAVTRGLMEEDPKYRSMGLGYVIGKLRATAITITQ